MDEPWIRKPGRACAPTVPSSFRPSNGNYAATFLRLCALTVVLMSTAATAEDSLPQLLLGPWTSAVPERKDVVAKIEVSLTMPDQTKSVTVEYTTIDGTATAGLDYTATSGTLTFAPGTTRAMFSVPILDDVRDEADETLSVTLADPSSNAQLGERTSIDIVIMDDDLPTVSIAHAREDVGEYLFENESTADDGAWIVTRSGDGIGALTVYYAAKESGGPSMLLAVESQAPRTVRFVDGETAVALQVIESDAEDEGHGMVTVTLMDGPDYDVAMSPADIAGVAVRDDDGALLTFSFEPFDQDVREGDRARFSLVAETVDDGTFTAVGDLARVFGATGTSLFWSTETLPGEATSPNDYPPVSERVAVAFSDFHSEEEGDGLHLRMPLPVIPVRTDEIADEGERFLVKLETAPGSDRRMRIAERENLSGIAVDLSGPSLLRGVVAIVNAPPDGELRLVLDATEVYAPDDCRDREGHAVAPCEVLQGRVEMTYNGEWGTICDDYWTDADAGVACRQLGFVGPERNGGRFLKGHFGEGHESMPIWLDNLLCVGDEERLIDCRRHETAVGEHNCRHSEDVGVRCLLPTTEQASVGRSRIPRFR